mgnify:CR=1 FL=1
MKSDNREIIFTPAFDKRSDDPKKNFGIQGMDITFVLQKEKGAISFSFFTNMYLPKTQKELKDSKVVPSAVGGYINIHSLTPLYENQTPNCRPCAFLDGKDCYLDGSSLAANRIGDIFIAEGEDAVWEELETFYRSVDFYDGEKT